MRELHGAKDDSDARKRTWWRFCGSAVNSLRFAELADCYRRAGALAEATAVCARGLLRYPNYATGHVVMGEILCARGLTERAREQWQQAIRLDPHHPRAHYRLGELHLAQGEREEAVAELELALLADPGFTEAQVLLQEARAAGAPAGEGSKAPRRVRRRPPATAAAISELLARLQEADFVRAALISDGDGLPMAETPAWKRTDPEAAAAVSAALAWESRQLLLQVGAGELTGALLRGEAGAIRCVALGQATLIAELDPAAPLGAAEAEIREALGRLNPCGGSDDGETDVKLAAA